MRREAVSVINFSQSWKKRLFAVAPHGHACLESCSRTAMLTNKVPRFTDRTKATTEKRSREANKSSLTFVTFQLKSRNNCVTSLCMCPGKF